ncbi:hypothetical protein ACKTEK_00025 [Tepidamorphus sp. 3E244]|uniref:hypothetical protein n=1 Tax=Tepidamorphus sp. 3E244 TaxID=3385498 RepID=UPI0038FCA4C3
METDAEAGGQQTPGSAPADFNRQAPDAHGSADGPAMRPVSTARSQDRTMRFVGVVSAAVLVVLGVALLIWALV